jgi:hypothetical protein
MEAMPYLGKVLNAVRPTQKQGTERKEAAMLLSTEEDDLNLP